MRVLQRLPFFRSNQKELFCSESYIHVKKDFIFILSGTLNEISVKYIPAALILVKESLDLIVI